MPNGIIRPIPEITAEEYTENPALAIFRMTKQLEENQRVICTKLVLKNNEFEREIGEIKKDVGEIKEDVEENKNSIMGLLTDVGIIRGTTEETKKDKALKYTKWGILGTLSTAFVYFLIDKMIELGTWPF